MQPDQDPKSRFSDRVEQYRQYRPGYPRAAFAFVREHLGPSRDWSIADIGSGTGISTRMLLEEFTCTVHAVEPNAAMREAAELTLGGLTGFRSVAGSAEATTLEAGSMEMVAAFQAYHWFAPDTTDAEFRRILKAPGRVLLAWNDRQSDGSPFMRGYEALLQELPEYARVNHRTVTPEDINAFMGGDGLITAGFEHCQEFDFAGLAGRFFSSSYTPAAGTAAYEKQVDRLRKLYAQTNRDGLVRFIYNTVVFLGMVQNKN